jgi:multicomponent K+:H+ antiporter subunit A
MKVPVELLVALCLAVGILPGYTIAPLLDASAGAVLQRPLPDFNLSLWHGFNLPFVMSLIALAGGVIVYAMRARVFALHDRFFPPVSGKNAAEGLLLHTFRAAEWLNARMETGSLQRYLMLLVVAALVVGFAGYAGQPLRGSEPTLPLNFANLVIGVLLIAGAVATVWMHRQRLVAVILIGIVGLMVSLVFVSLSAPDVAMTQLLVEFVTVVLVLLALFFLPQRTHPESSPARRARDAAVAVLAGSGAAALTYAMLTRPLTSISEFFIAEAKSGGGGTNVVNVILVDFRGTDTLGEIIVLGIAAVGIYVMLASLSVRVPASDADGRPWSPERHPLILAVIARPLLPIALLVSVYLFLRGHNLPGGGFIAALVTASAVILQYLSDGSAMAQSRLGWRYMPFIGVGVLIAAATGVGSWLLGYPFLTSAFTYIALPVVGEFELASAMAFDLGVYIAVVGTVLLILAYLGRLNAPLDSMPIIRWPRDRS